MKSFFITIIVAVLVASISVDRHVTASIYPFGMGKGSFPAMSLHFIVPGSLRIGADTAVAVRVRRSVVVRVPVVVRIGEIRRGSNRL